MPQREAAAVDRFLKPPQIAQAGAAIDRGLDIIRTRRLRAAETLDRLPRLPQLAQDIAHIVKCYGIVRIDGQRFLEQSARFFQQAARPVALAGLPQRHAKIDHGLQIIRLELQRMLVPRDGVGAAPGHKHAVRDIVMRGGQIGVEPQHIGIDRDGFG